VFEEAAARLASAQTSGRRGEEEASARLWLAELQLACERREEAFESAEAAWRGYRELGDECRQAEAVRMVVKTQLARGRLREASALERRERESFEKAGRREAAALMLLSCSDVQLAQGDPRKALKAASTAVASLKQLGAVRGQVLALHQEGEALKEFNEAAKMLDVVKRAGPLLEELCDDVWEARVMEIKSHAYQVAGDPMKALEATKAGLALSRRAGDKIGEGAALNNIANAYLMMQGSAADALEAAVEAFTHCTATGNRREAAFALGEIVSACCMMENLDGAIEAQKKMVELARERGDQQQLQTAADNLAYLQSAR